MNTYKFNLSLFLIIVFEILFQRGWCQEKPTEPYKEEYKDYIPDFEEKAKRWKYTDKEFERSSEIKFYTLNEVEEINRANSLVKVAIDNEENGDFRKAMTLYQEIISRFSIASENHEVLYRVSSYGIFVPIAQYCQRRILNFPKEHLEFYRTLKDPEAKELFDEAVKKYSLEMFSLIVDKYLATSYGGKALQYLGDAALDRGNYLEALENFKTIETFITDKAILTPELKLKIQFCEKALGQQNNLNHEIPNSNEKNKELDLLKLAIQKELPKNDDVVTQRSSNEYISADDYSRFKPSKDPLGLLPSEWENNLLSSTYDFYVYGQPVITDTSIIVRLKNIIYCYSILNGSMRWKNDMGGKAVWQNWSNRQYPLEDVVIQDGVIITPIYKGGSSLIALDEITGQIKWSYGPINSSEGDESLMRFECTPAAGPGTFYANYVLDNIKGDTHIDTEYGVIAFDSVTGAVKWRRQICRLQPGKFDGGFGNNRKNRIRSFFTPPLYHEGTIYVSSNAGAVAAMDSLSGRIKWLMRYPYYPSVHDLTRQFGTLYQFGGGVPLMQPHAPMFWLNQRPLIVGENLYILPINSPFMLCINRKNGIVNWTFDKPTAGFNYFMGPISTGELVVTGNGRKIRSLGSIGETSLRDPLYLLDPKTGKINWKAPDIILKDDSDVMNCGFGVGTVAKQYGGAHINARYFETCARPFLMEGDRIILSNWTDQSWRYPKDRSYMAPVEIDMWQYRPGMYVFAFCELDLVNRKIINQRRYYTDAVLVNAEQIINDNTNRNHWKMPMGAPLTYADLEKIPRKTKEQEDQMEALLKVMNDKVPTNEHPAFIPFSRVTFSRFGVPFELRLSPRKISMVYNRIEFENKIANDSSISSLFAKSELCVRDADYKKASEYLNQCMKFVSPEDINFRALIKQQHYKVYLELVRAAIRANKPKEQLENTLGMSNTASVIAEEIETHFALVEAYESNGNIKNAAACLRTLIEVYGQYEYPISSLSAKSFFNKEDLPQVHETFSEILTEANANVGTIYKKEVNKALEIASNSIPLYLSTVSPLPKELTVRTGDLAILKFIELLKKSDDYLLEYSNMGDSELSGEKVDSLIYNIWKYPNTKIGQETFTRIYSLTKSLDAEIKRNIWRKLGHISKICKFNIPKDLMKFLEPEKFVLQKEIQLEQGEKTYEISNFKDSVMITLEREGDILKNSNLLFIGVRIPKKTGFRFSIICFDLNLGKEIWCKEEFRLKDLGKEPGFYKAYIYQDTLVVHGLYDVFGFSIKDGAEIWHYKTPFNFEIIEASISGNLFCIISSYETIALQVDTTSPIGEVAWQQKEEGNIYYKPYFIGDVLISIRKFPFNITSRIRTTGSLFKRLNLPDLSLIDTHPLLKDGPLGLSIATYDRYLAVTDEVYLIIYDTIKMEMLWKTPLLNVDRMNDLKLRIEMNEKFVICTKADYDRKAIYCYNLQTGDIVWNTDPTNPDSLQPVYSLLLDSDILYGIGLHPGQGFFISSYDCKNGIKQFEKSVDGYEGIPIVKLRHFIYGNHLVAEVQDRKNFQILIFNKNTGEILKKISEKGDGPIGEVGRVAITIQDGHPILFSKSQFKY